VPQGWFTWDASWMWSVALILCTIVIHVSCLILIMVVLRKLRLGRKAKWHFFDRATGVIIVVVAVALILVIMHALECAIWATVYLHLGALGTWADAMLYSVDSMTARGSSHLTLEHRWLMMGSIESVNGLLLFGMSTAVLFAVFRRVWMTL
jgi:hypothetical protein